MTGSVIETSAAQGGAAPGVGDTRPALTPDRSPAPAPQASAPVLLRGAPHATDPLGAELRLPAGLSDDAAARAAPVDAARRLGDALEPTVTAPVEAALVPTRRWLLPKGSFLDCTLETAIDSTLAGLVTCVLATDAFGADGRVVLLERGTRLIGETRSEVRAGQARVVVLWSEARTPTGVSVSLASPGTDALGRAGLPGEVDRHAGERFGAAVLLSLVDGGMNAIAARQQASGAVIYNAQGSRDVATEVLRNTLAIPPTIRVPPGARVMVAVVRDVDFRRVYRLVVRDDH